MKYPIYQPDIHQYTRSVHSAIDSGWISSQGEYIKKTTQCIQNVLQTPYAVLVNNGTSATHLLYKSLKFKYPNLSKIYVPNYVFVAVWNAALYEYPMNMISVLEMDSTTLNMRVDEEYIMSLEPNSAVVVVHNVGNVINVPRLQHIRPDIVFVEDVCEAFLEEYEGKRTGTASLCAAVSFFANKLITSGEGGVWYTNDKELYDFVYKSCHHGTTTERYVYDVLGYNYRMTNLQAALLYDQLCDIDTILKKKRDVYSRYKTLLSGWISTTGIWMMIARIPGMKYSDIYRILLDRGIDTRPMFYEIQKHPHLQNIQCPYQSIGHEELIMLPSSPSLTAYDQVYIVSTLRQVLKGKHLDIVRADLPLLTKFVSNELPSTFRYFNTRTPEYCLKTHELTILGMIDGEPIGYAHIDENWLGVCVLPNYQGTGFGSILVDFILDYAKLQNIPLRLTVDIPNERAIELYKKKGFSIAENTSTYYLMKL